MVFYRNIGAAALDIAPDETMRAIADEVVGFEMPGATMAGFRRSSMMIAKAGIYDLRLHYDEVLMPVLRHWKVFERTDLGEGARRRATTSRRSSRGWTPRPPGSSSAGPRTARGPPPARTPTRPPTSPPDIAS